MSLKLFTSPLLGWWDSVIGELLASLGMVSHLAALRLEELNKEAGVQIRMGVFRAA